MNANTGQVIIVPHSELRPIWIYSLQFLKLRVASFEVTTICRSGIGVDNDVNRDVKVDIDTGTNMMVNAWYINTLV